MYVEWYSIALVADLIKQRTQEYEAKRITCEEKIAHLNGEVERIKKQNESLSQQLSSSSETYIKRKEVLQEELRAAKQRFGNKEDQLRGEKDKIRREHELELDRLNKKVKEQSLMLKEYQEKV